jgi:hypothetical protein
MFAVFIATSVTIVLAVIATRKEFQGRDVLVGLLSIHAFVDISVSEWFLEDYQGLHNIAGNPHVELSLNF